MILIFNQIFKRFNYLTKPMPTQLVAKRIMSAILGYFLTTFLKKFYFWKYVYLSEPKKCLHSKSIIFVSSLEKYFAIQSIYVTGQFCFTTVETKFWSHKYLLIALSESHLYIKINSFYFFKQFLIIKTLETKFMFVYECFNSKNKNN